MTRAKGVPSQRTVDVQWPHQVSLHHLDDLELQERFRTLRACEAFCAGRTVFAGAGSGYLIWCFAHRDDAWAFHDRFGGEAWSIEPVDRHNALGWKTGVKGYRKVPRA